MSTLKGNDKIPLVFIVANKSSRARFNFYHHFLSCVAAIAAIGNRSCAKYFATHYNLRHERKERIPLY